VSTLPKLGQPANDGDDRAVARKRKSTRAPLEASELCVARLTSALRGACPDLTKADAPDEMSLAIRAHGDHKFPKKTRALGEALSIAVPSRNELRDPMWLLRREVAAATDVLLRKTTEWRELIGPIVQHNLEREARLGPLARMFPATFIPWLVSFIDGGMGFVAHLTDLQLLNPDTRSRGRPPDHVQNDVTRILDRAGFSVSEIAGLTEKVNDRDARKRVRNRLNEMKRTRKRRAGKREVLSAQARDADD
jgi:hypothetical protein